MIQKIRHCPALPSNAVGLILLFRRLSLFGTLPLLSRTEDNALRPVIARLPVHLGCTFCDRGLWWLGKGESERVEIETMTGRAIARETQER